MKRKRRRKVKSKALIGLIIILVLIIAALVGGIYAYNIFTEKDGMAKYLKIKLNGKKEVTINYNEEYEDEGASASYKKEDISKDIKIKNDVDNSKIGDYKITYSIKYKKSSKSIYRMVKVVDTKQPEITLNGQEVVTIYKDNKYDEQGAKANDEYDGDITDKISTSSNVDNKKVGEYEVTYTVKDSSDNEVTKTRKVKVIEKPAPTPTPTPKPSNDNTGDGVIGKTSKGFTIEKKNGIYYIGGVLIANKSYSLPSNYNPGDLLGIFKENFNKMQSDARNEGISLEYVSKFRNYSSQASIYNRYVQNDGQASADSKSARPGHSEHQTGLAADINSLYQSWGQTAEGKWLNNNCYKYGFIIRYPKGKESITGYMYEPWHIRYVGVELATKLYNNGNWITLEEYLGIDSKY